MADSFKIATILQGQAHATAALVNLKVSADGLRISLILLAHLCILVELPAPAPAFLLCHWPWLPEGMIEQQYRKDTQL